MPASFERELEQNGILRSLYLHSKVNSILVTDEQGQIIHLNEAFTLNYGYTLEDLRGQHGSVLFTPEAREAGLPEREIQGARAKGFTRDRNFLLHRDGYPVWTDGETVWINSDSGASYLFKIVQNLQEQWQLESSLREAMEFSDDVVGSIREGLLVLSRERRILRTNPALSSILDIDQLPEDGQPLQELDHPLFSAPEFNQELEAMIRDKQGRQFFFPCRTRTGTLRVLSLCLSLLDGKETGDILLVLSDETAAHQETERLQRSEQQLRNLVESSPVACCVYAGSGLTVTLANEAMLAYWGRSADVLGKPLREVLPELEGQPFLPHLEEVFTTGRTYSAKDQPAFLLREGVLATYYFDYTFTPLRDGEGSIYAVMNTAVDVTDRVQSRLRIEAAVRERTRELVEANEALLQSNSALQQSNERLEEFAHAASHDLKEPIRKIRVFNSQLRQYLDGQLGEREARLFDRINSASERMVSLVGDLMVYAHLSEDLPLAEVVDLNTELGQVLEDLDLAIQEKGAVIQLGPLPVVHGYRRQLRQLFQNLLSNALKFTREGVRPSIRLAAETEMVEGQCYRRISIADNGIGFETEYAEKIFRMFTRLHGRTQFEGTGAGLAIARKVAENHHGFIRAHSRLGEGATFQVYFPECKG